MAHGVAAPQGSPGFRTTPAGARSRRKHRRPARAVNSRRAIPRAGARRTDSWRGQTSEHTRTPGRSAAAQKITASPRRNYERAAVACRWPAQSTAWGINASSRQGGNTPNDRRLLARFTTLTPESWGFAFVLKRIRTGFSANFTRRVGVTGDRPLTVKRYVLSGRRAQLFQTPARECEPAIRHARQKRRPAAVLERFTSHIPQPCVVPLVLRNDMRALLRTSQRSLGSCGRSSPKFMTTCPFRLIRAIGSNTKPLISIRI